MAVKQVIIDFLGPEKFKWVHQEYLGGAVLPVNAVTKQLFEYVFNSVNPDDKDTVEYLNNGKYIWVGTESDYNDNIKGTKYYKDEILYLLIPPDFENLFKNEH